MHLRVSASVAPDAEPVVLVQLAGAELAVRTVTNLAVRLDIPRRLASRLATDLEGLALDAGARSAR